MSLKLTRTLVEASTLMSNTSGITTVASSSGYHGHAFSKTFALNVSTTIPLLNTEWNATPYDSRYSFSMLANTYRTAQSFVPTTSIYHNYSFTTATPTKEPVPEYVNILHKIQIGILITALAISIFGNSLVLAVTYLRFTRVSVANFLIAHLAFCDLAFALFTPFVIHSMIHDYEWIFGYTMCKIVRSAVQLGSNVACGVIVVIAIDRYRGISDPLRPRWKKRHAAFACLIVWLISVANITPSILILDIDEKSKMCYENWRYFDNIHAGKIYSLYSFIFGFVIPVSIIAVLYWRIIKFLKSPQVKFAHSQLTKEYLEKRRKEDQRVTRLLSFVVIAFVLCILPNKLVWVIFDFAWESLSPRAIRILNYVAVMPYPFHVAVNPLIYSIIDIKFRQHAKDFLMCKQNRRRSSFASSQYVNGNSFSMNTINEKLD